jgi:enamine deaminase RidA (YjgF/YER057c/UK114 family)
VTLDEKTEVTIPLKIIVTIISFVVISSWYVSTTQNRIKDLEHRVEAINEKFDAYKKAPARNQLEVELLTKDFYYMNKKLDQLIK